MSSYVQLIGSNQSKTAGTSLAISVSLTITASNSVFVAFASDDVGSAFGITDNLGNNYAQVGSTQTQAGNIKTQLWAALITTGGTLTTVTMAWTTNITAKAIVAGEYGLSGGLRSTSGNAGSASGSIAIPSTGFFDGELWVGAFGVEDNVAAVVSGTSGGQALVSAGTNATSGGGSSSNIAVTLGHILIAGSFGSSTLLGVHDGTQNYAAAGAIYHGYKLNKPLILQQAVNRASTY